MIDVELNQNGLSVVALFHIYTMLMEESYGVTGHTE